MLPQDPEREAIGRSIAAVLMAQQIKRSGQIHPETLLTEIGALAGFAAQMSIRKSIIEPQKLDPDNDPGRGRHQERRESTTSAIS